MRALSVITSIVDDAMWILTVVAFGLLLFAPTIVSQPMPFFGGTVQQFLIDWRVEAVMVLVGFSMLSGRWPTRGMRAYDWKIVFCCALVLVSYCVAAFAWRDITHGGDLVRADLPLGLKKDLVIVTAFAFLSVFSLKTDTFLATSLRGGAAGSGAAAGDELAGKIFGDSPLEVPFVARLVGIRKADGPIPILPAGPPVIEGSSG